MIWATLVEMLAANVWPLVGILIALLILKQVKDDVRPIFLALVAPLTRNAASNAIQWVMGILLAVLSLLGALSEVAVTMKWVAVGILCKLAGPPIATVIALVNRSPVSSLNGNGNGSAPAPKGSTAAPFPTASPPVT